MIYGGRTLDNILSNHVAAANIVHDPVLFVKSALSELGPEEFEYAARFPILKDVQGWIRFDCICKRGKDISVVEFSLCEATINKRIIKPVNRGFNAVIEAAIHATRYVILKEPKYLEHINYYNAIVKKCGGAREKEAMRLLYELIGHQKSAYQ